MNPIPSITKVFSLLIQEEHQRSVDLHQESITTPLTAETTKKQGSSSSNADRNHKKDGPISSNCGKKVILLVNVTSCMVFHRATKLNLLILLRSYSTNVPNTVVQLLPSYATV